MRQCVALVAQQPFDFGANFGSLLAIVRPAAPSALANEGKAVVKSTGLLLCDEEDLCDGLVLKRG